MTPSRPGGCSSASAADLEDNGPDGFWSIVFDHDEWNYVDNVMYLSQAGPVKLGLEAAITERLHLGEADEDPRATAFRDLRGSSPESLDHVGIRYAAFVGARARRARAQRGHRARRRSSRAVPPSPGTAPDAGQDPEIDDAMAEVADFRDRETTAPRSPTTRVQVFVKTDLCTTGLFALGQTIELDYFWPPAFETMPDFGRGRRVSTG